MKIDQTEIINIIKLLIYKENSKLLKKIDFDDDNVFLEPLLFTYFNCKNNHNIPNEILHEIMQGYFVKRKEIKICSTYNSNEFVYVPQIGYFKCGDDNFIESISIIKNTKIELLKYPIKLLETIFKNPKGEFIRKEDIVINKSLIEKNINALTNAFNYIKENSPKQFELIELCCKKVLVFKTNPENTNSFATINAHGIAFLNVYQDDYDEVFFVDDIAHQTGHIILTTFFHDRKSIFKIDEEQILGDFLSKKDNRSIYVLIHAFYTYYATLICLDDCLKNNVFKESQEKEAIGRIGFYLKKCAKDFNNFDAITTHFKGIDKVLTSTGIEIYSMIKDKYQEIYFKWNSKTKDFDYSNQTYNFAFKNFKERNK